MKITKKGILAIIAAVVLVLVSVVFVVFSRNDSGDNTILLRPTIDELKTVISNRIESDDRDSSNIQLSENMEWYDDSWVVIPVSLLNERPDSYDRDYLFIIDTRDQLNVVAYQPPGWFTGDMLQDEMPDQLKEHILGEPHGE